MTVTQAVEEREVPAAIRPLAATADGPVDRDKARQAGALDLHLRELGPAATPHVAHDRE